MARASDKAMIPTRTFLFTTRAATPRRMLTTLVSGIEVDWTLDDRTIMFSLFFLASSPVVVLSEMGALANSDHDIVVYTPHVLRRGGSNDPVLSFVQIPHTSVLASR